MHKGTAVSFCSGEETALLKNIEKYTHHKIKVTPVGKGDYQQTLNLTKEKTESLAEWLSLLDRKSVGHLCFLIGGPDGLHPSILESAHESISLSPLTFTHEMARFLLIEQVYRVLSFRAGHPYHRV